MLEILVAWLPMYKSPEKGTGLGSSANRDIGSTSFAAIGATLVPTVLTAAIFLACFVYLRPRYRNIYAPRTYFKTIPEKDRTPTTRPGSKKWYHDFLWIDDRFLLRHHSLDAYLFLRFFRVIILICFVGCCITWPILFPVNATGGGNAAQLDRISFSNATGKNRLYAHAIVAWLFVGFILLVITRERMFLVGLKQAYLTTKQNSLRLSSRTVLFLAAPPAALKKDHLQKYFGPTARRSWVVPDLTELANLVEKRNNKVFELETAEVNLARNVTKEHGKHQQSVSAEGGDRAVEPDDRVRPTTRTTPVVGKKVDEIDWHLNKLPDIIEEINSKRESIGKSEPRGSGAIFVEFNDQLSAYQAYESVRHHSPLALQPRYIGVQPKEVIWSSLTLDSSSLILYSYISIAVLVAIILLWSIPVGFVATITNINYLTKRFHFLEFINNLPAPILGLITGFLPAYLLSTLVQDVPVFFRYISKLAGAATTVEAESRTQNWYFVFQVVQLFLITTFSSGAAAVAQQIAEQPKIIPQLLADNLPKASNFYLSYFILQGIASSAKNIINYSDVASYLFFDKFFDKTPRQKYDRLAFMRGVSWGTVYPKFANLTIIAIAYSCIAPLVLGFATVGFFFFYLSYRYNLLYTKQVKIETKGDAYGRALQHLMVGVYLLELCLLGLLSAREAEGPSTILIILLVATVLYHVTVNRYLSPLERYMPVDVLSEDEDEDEEQPLLSAEEGQPERPAATSENTFLHSLAGRRLPAILLDPLAALLEPSFFASHESLRGWLSDERSGDDESPEYSEEDMNNAYLHPALTSKTPKMWLAKDTHKVSQWAIEKNSAAGLTTTDDGATLDQNNHIHWDKEDLSAAPIFKTPKRY